MRVQSRMTRPSAALPSSDSMPLHGSVPAIRRQCRSVRKPAKLKLLNATYCKAFCLSAPARPMKVMERSEILKHLEKWAGEEIVPMLKGVEKSWQAQDFLPAPDSEAFLEEVQELRARAAGLADDYLVCLVGDTITEEALPTYQTMLTSFVGVTQESAWATWVRGWTAEENRHGDLLHKYLYLTGRVNMRMVERTTHHLLSTGMDVGLEQNPYYGFIYTSFQERATAISHGNTARLAGAAGDNQLAKICGTIAADEKRHERAYAKVVDKLLELDPEETVVALEEMMRRKIVMPAHLMYDGQDPRLFHHFSRVAQRVGIYTTSDYIDILHHYIKRWNLSSLSLSSGQALAAQDYICSLPTRLRKLEERSQSRAAREASPPTISFSWIFDRNVAL